MSAPLEKQIDDVVTYMALSTSGSHVGLTRFDGAEPMLRDFYDAAVGAQDDVRKAFIHLPEGVTDMLRIPPRAISGAFDVPWLCPVNAPATIADRYRFGANRFRRASPQERKRAVRVYPEMFALESAVVTTDGTHEQAVHMVGWDGRGWQWASPKHYGDVIASSLRLAAVGTLQQWVRPFYWWVWLGYEGSPRVRFVTSARGAAEVFRLRDIPNGASRRSALIHWVKEHWRKSQSDAAEEHRVRTHLRGSTSFVWNGLRCEITPSQSDLVLAGRAVPAAQKGGAS